VALAVALLLTAGAGCLWWLRGVPEPRWSEIGILGLLVVAVGFAIIGTITGELAL
jgi:hypothetical protein